MENHRNEICRAVETRMTLPSMAIGAGVGRQPHAGLRGPRLAILGATHGPYISSHLCTTHADRVVCVSLVILYRKYTRGRCAVCTNGCAARGYSDRALQTLAVALT